MKSNFITIAHRGAAIHAPENTLAAIRAGLSFNPERIEIDVHQSADDIVISIHDETVNRTSNGTGKVKDLSFDQIQQLDGGSWFDPKFEGEKIPSLDQVLQLINGQSTLVIEVKDGNKLYPKIEENIVYSIKKYKAHKWVIVHSFETEVLHTFHAIDPALTLHKVYEGKAVLTDQELNHQIKAMDFDTLPYVNEYSFNFDFINPRILTFFHKHGKKVNAWTINDPIKAKQLIKMGLDGVITDDPSIVK